MPTSTLRASADTSGPLSPQWRPLSDDQLTDPTLNLGADAAFDELLNGTGWKNVTRKTTAAGQVVVDKKRMANGMTCIRNQGFAKGLTPAEVAAASVDIEGAPQWSTNGLVAGRIMASAPGRMTYYQVMKVPKWTFMPDTYWCNDGTLTISPDGTYTYAFKMASEADRADASDEVHETYRKAKEPKDLIGRWTFKPADGGTEVTYMGGTDTGIRVPGFVENWALGRAAPKAMAGVIAEAARRAGKDVQA